MIPTRCPISLIVGCNNWNGTFSAKCCLCFCILARFYWPLPWLIDDSLTISHWDDSWIMNHQTVPSIWVQLEQTACKVQTLNELQPSLTDNRCFHWFSIDQSEYRIFSSKRIENLPEIFASNHIESRFCLGHETVQIKKIEVTPITMKKFVKFFTVIIPKYTFLITRLTFLWVIPIWTI